MTDDQIKVREIHHIGNGPPVLVVEWDDVQEAEAEAFADTLAEVYGAGLVLRRSGPVDIKTEQEFFIHAFSTMADHIHETAKAKGWWDPPKEVVAALETLEVAVTHAEDVEPVEMQALDLLRSLLTDRNDGEMLALFHSEISECLEGLRHGNPPSDKIPEFNQAEEELADLFIRAMDTAKARGWRLPEAIVAKMAFNEGRPYRHGKKF